MEKLIMVIGDHRHPNAHHLKRSGTVRVGRSLSCDVILSDYYVDALQLVFHEQEGKRTVEVCVSINPVRRNGETVKPGLYDFASGDEWSIGRTTLSVFNESHVVAPTEKLLMYEYRGSNVARLALVMLLLSTLSAFLLLCQWLGAYEPFEWKKEFGRVMPTLTSVFVWAAVWAAIGRFITGKKLFVIHFLASVFFVMAVVSSEALTTYLSYALNMDLFWEITGYVILSLLIALLLYINSAYATNIKNMKMMQLMLGLCCGVFLYFIDHEADSKLKPHFNQAIKAPWAILIEAETVESFMYQTNKGFVEVVQEAGE